MKLTELKRIHPDNLTNEELEQRIMDSFDEINNILDEAHARIDQSNAKTDISYVQ